MDIRDRYIRFDWAIKRLLRQKANFGVLEGFLTVFLGEKVEIVDILESESNQHEADDKFNRVDIKARNSKGEIIIVEVQNTTEVFYLERILYGVAKAITEHINLGDTYEEVKKVYSISILYFDIGQGEDYIYKGQNHFVGLHTNDELKITTRERDTLVRKAPEDVFPTYYLIRVKNFDKVAVSPMEEWMRYLKEGIIGDDPKAPGLKEAKAKLQYYLMDKKERYAYDEHINAVMIQNDVIGNAKREGLAEGRAEGLAQGKAEGLAQGKAEGLAQGKAEGLAQGKAEGLAQGKAEGLAQGKAEGLAQGKAEGLAQGKAEGLAQGLEKGLAQGLEKGLAQGKAEGIAEGMEKEREANLKRMTDLARNMLADGMSADSVMQYTGLTKEQIDKL